MHTKKCLICLKDAVVERGSFASEIYTCPNCGKYLCSYVFMAGEKNLNNIKGNMEFSETLRKQYDSNAKQEPVNLTNFYNQYFK